MEMRFFILFVFVYFNSDFASGRHLCMSSDIAQFCVVPQLLVTNKLVFPNLTNLIPLLPTMERYRAWYKKPGNIHTYQPMCELSKVTVKGGKKNFEDKNPFFIDIAEIEEDGRPLRNWLHLKIYAKDKALTNNNGKMKYLLLIATDQDGWPFGDFDNDRTESCGCTGEECYFAAKWDAIPCMWRPRYAVTHPGMIMIDRKDKEVNEFHVNFHFAQSSHNLSFVTEIHFRSIIIDDEGKHTYTPGTDYLYQEDISRDAILEWQAQYTILLPKVKTLGAWNFYSEKYSSKNLNCHVQLRTEYFDAADYPDYDDKYITNATYRHWNVKPENWKFYDSGVSGDLYTNPNIPASMVGMRDQIFTWLCKI